ncbi:MAG: lamin tail domain-containing protein [Bacteroidales bacterium]
MTDDFSDGDFLQNPSWTGDVEDFLVNDDFQLQVNADPESAPAHLSTGFTMLQENEWRFWIRLAFSPSANNFARVYLISDQQNTEGSLNGYFLQFGESGSDDAIELYRKQGETETLICRGTDGAIASSFEMAVRIRRNSGGDWTLETDPTGTGAYVAEAQGNDIALTIAGYVGVFCNFTSSNADAFYFDDFYAGAPEFDTDPPQLVTVEVSGSQHLELYFDEALLAAPAEQTQNYAVDQNIENPLQAVLDQGNPSHVSLTFERAFPVGQTLVLKVENMEDLSGNVAGEIQRQFVWFTPSYGGIVINEIMADPTPVVGLPDWEYLELYNNTPFGVDLEGWRLFIGTTEKLFENISIGSGQYLILANDDAENELGLYGSFYGFSGFSLTNTGQTVVLMNPEDAVVHTISYTDDWYADDIKSDGGWSLEQIDPQNPCGGIENWMAGRDASGGTPGAVNSIDAENPDEAAPFFARVEVIAPDELVVHFSEPMDSVSIAESESYIIDHGIGPPAAVQPRWPDYRKALLFLDQNIEPCFIYELKAVIDLTDCAGNIVDKTVAVRFGLPEHPGTEDIVINEVLYNPKDEYVKGVDFVEIYNRSSKIIDLAEIVLATVDDVTGDIDSPRPVSESGFLFFPSEYLVLTTDPEVVMIQYHTENPGGFLRMESLPAYSNDEGVVVLATNSLEIIDRFAYIDEMQYALLNSTDGVSLERISFDRPASDPTNWHSAAEDAGFATPAYQNSQFSLVAEIDDAVKVEPEVFSPDNDGFEDVLNISYAFNKPGYTCNINIYDARGRPTRNLISNALLGASGTFSWDGLTDDNQKAGIGIYIILIEIFDLDGNTHVYKKSAVLGTKL